MISMVDVWTEGVPGRDVVLVGRAYFNLRRGSVSCSFVYDSSYLVNPDAFSIDPALPLSSATMSTNGLPGCMRDSAPDRWGRHLIARRRAMSGTDGPAFQALDEVDFLLGVHDRARQGALRFAAADDTVFLSQEGDVPPLVSLPKIIDASNMVARDEDGLQQIKELLDAGSGSLGGARPKASVVDDGRLLLAKFSHPSDEWDVMAWEKTVLDLARIAGIEVPSTRLLRFGSDSALLLDRFDRFAPKASGGDCRRVPYISGMTLLSSQDGEPRDYLELAEALPLVVNQTARSLAELFRRIVFSIAVHSTDDHLRNIGLLRFGGSWRLSPLFDVNPNPSLKAERVTSIYGETGEGEIQALRDSIAEFGLALADASEIVREVVSAVSRWRVYARRNGVRESELSVFAPMFKNRLDALSSGFTVDG